MNEVWLVILPLIAGYLLDLAFGDPRTIPHPVVGFGNMISWAERHFNCGRFRKWKGAVVALSFPLFVGGKVRANRGKGFSCQVHCFFL